MAKRTNVDRLTRPGQRNRLNERALQRYVAAASAGLQERLKQAALRDRALDLEIAGDSMAETRRTTKPASRGWPKRGEIHLTALDPAVGQKIAKTRPALVAQNDTSNRHSATILVAPVTSTIKLPLSPMHVLLPADASTGLAVRSVAVCNQIRAVDRKRLVKKLGSVDGLVLAQVDEAINAAFGLTRSLLGLDLESPPTITDAISASTGDFRTGRYEG